MSSLVSKIEGMTSFETPEGTVQVPLPKMELRDLRTVSRDPEYQRPTSDKKIKQIRDHFQPESLGVFIVSHRTDDTEVMLDGQHRQAAAVEVGYFVHWCQIYEGLTQAQEAAIFVGCNTQRFVPSPFYRFRAQKVAAVAGAADIERICAEMGAPISNSHGKGITAVTAVQKIFEKGGEPYLRQVIGLTQEIWGGDLHVYDGYVLQALDLFLSAYGSHENFTVDKFIEKMKRQTLSDFLADANGFSRLYGGRTPINLARAFLRAYNWRIQVNKLPDLIGNKKPGIEPDFVPTPASVQTTDTTPNSMWLEVDA